MKKVIGIASFVASAATLSACSNADAKLGINIDTEQLIASSMYTIGTTIMDTQTVENTRRIASTSLTDEQYIQVTDSIQKYVDSVDKLMTDDLNTSFNNSTDLSIEGISDYQYVYELVLADSTYVMAYNKGEPSIETDGDDVESTANLVGKMYEIIDNELTITLDLVGYEEHESDENEFETEFFVKAKDAHGNYIKYEYTSDVETEEGDEESESEITFKSEINNVRTYSKTKIEIDNEDGFEVKITDKLDDQTGSYISEYEYLRSYDNEFDITYSYKGEDFETTGIVEVTVHDGIYKYTFVDSENGNKHEFIEEDEL